MICIIDYGVGNLSSIVNMIRKVGYYDVIISSSLFDIERANRVIIPGVGNFDFGMSQLKKSGLIQSLEAKVLVEKVPTLGICLGAQMMTHGSMEGKEKGLSWIDGKTVAFDKTRVLLNEDLKIPHMGWCDVIPIKESKLFSDMPSDPRFYFVHSYHLWMKDPQNVWLESNYGYPYCAAYEQDNIFGVQFHPEKSHKYGMQLFKNFIEL